MKLSIYQQGAITRYELEKKAKASPAFAAFKDPKLFAISFGWHQAKKKRGYTEEQAAEFLRGFSDACPLLAEQKADGR